MPRRHELAFALNAGAVDPKAITRVDLEKSRLAGEHPVNNLVPEVLGPLGIRPGTQSLSRIASDAETRQLVFQRQTGTGYVLLLSPSEMRVTLDGVVQQVPAVATVIASGSWTDESSGAASASGGATLTLNATTTASARLRQSVSVALADRTLVNILRVVVSAGPVFLKIGTTAGGSELMPGGVEAELDVGTHKIGVTPGVATIYIDVIAKDPVTRTVSQIQFESNLLGGSGDFVIPTPWTTIARIDALRTWQSIDVVFAGEGITQQRRIEHRGPLSWGVSLYRTIDGPFVFGDDTITMTPSALSGNTTLTASEAYFQSGHVGAVVEITQAGKVVTETLDAVDLATDYISVVGVGGGRAFTRIAVNSSFVGTIVLEQSFEPSEPSIWTTYATYVDGAASFSATETDTNDNLTVHYRFRCSAYTSGSVVVTLSYSAGVTIGLARITGYSSPTSVSIEVLQRLGALTATRNWRISDWSDVRGWPRVPVIHDSRLHWFRSDRDYASVPDDYTSFDDSIEGDSAPLNRSVGAGGEDGVSWALSDARLLVGTAGFEAVIAASEFDGPLTPTDYTVRKPSRRGCADIQAVSHDDGIFFAQRSRRKLHEIALVSGRFVSQNISRLNPAAYQPGIKRIAVQQQPDTRCYAVLDDGTLTVMTWEREDKVAAITSISLDGALVEDIVVLPQTDQDDIYLIVNRGGRRYHERFAKEADQWDVDTCTLLDGHKVLAGSISSITGATQFANQTVQVWADGQRRADIAINNSGVGALGATYSRVVYGKRYYGTYRSVKLAYAAGLGTAVGQTKIVRGVGLLLANACLDGIGVGPDADHLDPMPDIVDGAARTENQFFTHYDHDIMPINSDWNPDARVYVRIDSAEGPCTLQGIVMDIETRDGSANA